MKKVFLLIVALLIVVKGISQNNCYQEAITCIKSSDILSKTFKGNKRLKVSPVKITGGYRFFSNSILLNRVEGDSILLKKVLEEEYQRLIDSLDNLKLEKMDMKGFSPRSLSDKGKKNLIAFMGQDFPNSLYIEIHAYNKKRDKYRTYELTSGLCISFWLLFDTNCQVKEMYSAIFHKE